MLLGVSLSAGCVDAMADRSFSAQAIGDSVGRGSALCYLGAAEPPPSRAGRARLARDLRWKRFMALARNAGHEGAQLQQRHGGGCEEGEQRKPSGCQFTRAGFSGLWRFVSQCNFTRVCVCVCSLCVSVCVSLQHEQKATTRRKLINFKI